MRNLSGKCLKLCVDEQFLRQHVIVEKSPNNLHKFLARVMPALGKSIVVTVMQMYIIVALATILVCVVYNEQNEKKNNNED